MESLPLVLITGLDGYLGSHVALAFLENGNFRVRGTVTSLKNDMKMEKLVLGTYFSKIEIIETNILDEKSIVNSAENCDFIVHTIAPFFKKDKRPEEQIVATAVNCMTAVMKAG